MTTHFKKIIKYLIDRLNTRKFDFGELNTFLVGKLSEIFEELDSIKIEIEVTSPDVEEIHLALESGKIRSHQVDPIIIELEKQIKNALEKKTNNLQYTITKYPRFKDRISIGSRESFTPNTIETWRHYKRIDKIYLEFSVSGLDIKGIQVFVNCFDIEELNFAENIDALIKIKKKGDQKFSLLEYILLEKKRIKELKKFLCKDHKKDLMEIYGQPIYQEILNLHIFPEGFTSNTEITLDILQKDIYVQKRRKVINLKGNREYFHDLISKRLSNDEFKKIYDINSIGGIYTSVKTKSDELVYFIIDIDVSTMIKQYFSKQIVWTLTINITKAIIRTALKLGLTIPKCHFSGSRGLHVIWILDPDAIKTTENLINIPELHYKDLPGRSELKKNKKSVLYDKFKFLKTIAQSLVLYIVYQEKIDIPKEIIEKFKISHQYQLFKLSTEDNNELAILMDLSSMGRGVFRLYSFHPNAMLFGLPLNDIKNRKFLEAYLTFEKLAEDASIEKMKDRFKNKQDLELFFQIPIKLITENIRELLRPDYLMPYFYIILRFDTIQCFRSLRSKEFWYKFYAIRNLFEYLKSIIYQFKLDKDPSDLINYIEGMIDKFNILQKDNVINIIKQYLKHQHISYKLLDEKLTNFYYLNFFYDLRKDIFINQNKDDLILLFSDEFEFNNFLNQCNNIFRVVLEMISSSILTPPESLPYKKLSALKQFSMKIDQLIELSKRYLEIIKKTRQSKRAKQRLIRLIHIIGLLYFSLIDFLRAYNDNNGY